MKALCASILSLVLLNSAMGQPCVGCSLVCVAATQGADCDTCSPANCDALIDTAENLDADCNTCLNSENASCDGRVLTETNKLVCETYCEYDGTDAKCNLIDTMNAGYCDTNCEMSTTLTDCENNCDNQDCVWTGNTVCECSCDCTTGVDECRAGDGCGTDYICDENVADPPSGCICVPDCQATSECTDQTCDMDHECVLNGEKTACECSPLTCEDKTDCNPSCDAHHICETSSGVCECRLECDVNQNDEACGGACDLGKECQENVETTGCMCVESPTSDGSVLHASATVCIVAALYSVSV